MKKMFLVFIINLFLFCISCVQLEKEINPEIYPPAEYMEYPIITFDEISPSENENVENNFVIFKWYGYDDKYCPSLLSYQVFLDSVEFLESESKTQVYLTHLEKGIHSFCVLCKTPDSRTYYETVTFEITTLFENDYDPPEIRGYDYLNPHHSEYFFYTVNGIDWQNDQFVGIEVIPEDFNCLLNWTFCFKDKDNITEKQNLNYEIYFKYGDLSSEWINIQKDCEYLINIYDFKKYFKINLDHGGEIIVRIRCLDQCGNISDYIEKRIEIFYPPPTLEIILLDWNSIQGREYFKNIWENARDKNMIPAYSILVKNLSSYSGVLKIKTDFIIYTFRLNIGSIPLADVYNDIFLYDVFENKKIQDKVVIHGNQTKEIRFVINRNLETLNDYNIYDITLDEEELKMLLYSFGDEDGNDTSTIRINGSWEDERLLDKPRFYFEYPGWEIIEIAPEIEPETKWSPGTEYFVNFSFASLNSASTQELNWKINYNLIFNTDNR